MACSLSPNSSAGEVARLHSVDIGAVNGTEISRSQWADKQENASSPTAPICLRMASG